jgi:hypothetical protein
MDENQQRLIAITLGICRTFRRTHGQEFSGGLFGSGVKGSESTIRVIEIAKAPFSLALNALHA